MPHCMPLEQGRKPLVSQSMLEFSPEDPFPYVPGYGPQHYAAAKRHAAEVDAWLGLRVKEVEESLKDPGDGEQRWIDRHSSIFLTPYVELRDWLELLKPAPGTRVVDLGAGYGRLGFVLEKHAPGVVFEGFELVPERVQEGRDALARFGARHSKIEVANLASADFFPPEAQIYFIYDFGSSAAIAKTLEDLRKIAGRLPIMVVGRGRGVRDQIERSHPWLGSVHRPRHFAHYSVYQSFGE